MRVTAAGTRWIVAIVCVAIFSSSQAHAIIDLSAVGGISITNQNVSLAASANTSPRTLFSFGGFADFHIPETSLSITAGLLYTEVGSHQNYTSGFTTYDFDVKVPYLQFPGIVNYWFVEFFAAGLGFYFAVPGGSVTRSGTQTNSFIPTTYNATQSFNDAGYRFDDYGLIAHVQGFIPIGPSLFATGHLLYEFGLENVSSSSAVTIRNSNFLVLAGLGWGFD